MGDSIDDPNNRSSAVEDNPIVLISKSELSSLSEQIALSLDKMRQLEEQIRIIPELQKQLDNIKLSPSRPEDENQIRVDQQTHGINRDASQNYRIELKENNAPLRQLNPLQYRQNCDSITNIPTFITNRDQFRQHRHNSNATDVKQRSQVQSITSSNTLDNQRSSMNRLDHNYDLRKTSSPAINSLSRRETFIRNNTTRNNVLTNTKNHSDLNKPTSHRIQSNKRPITTHILISKPSTLKHTTPQTALYQQQVKPRPRHDASRGSNTIIPSLRQNNSASSGYTSLTRQGTYVIESNHKNFIMQHGNINDEELDSGSLESSTPTASPIQNLCKQLGNQLQKSTSMPVTPVMRQGKIMVDSSTMTELRMADIITRADMQSLLNSTANSATSTMAPISRTDVSVKTNSLGSYQNVTRRSKSIRRARMQSDDFDVTLEPQSSSSASPENSTDVYEDARVDDDQEVQILTTNHRNNQQLCSKLPAVTSSGQHISHVTIRRHRKKRRDSNNDNCNIVIDDDGDVDDDDDGDGDDDSSGTNTDDFMAEPFSLGSSYLDPSDFDEYYSYDNDARKQQTKDQHQNQNHNRNLNHHHLPNQMTHDNNNQHHITIRVPGEFKHAIRRFHTIINNCPGDKSQAHSTTLEMICTIWFEIVTKSETKLEKIKACVDYLETFNKNLTGCIINLSDKTGNTALHYAASNGRFDIIDLLIDTDVCDVNCRNKAGYTLIMLLSLIEINNQADRDTTKRVFMRADVNIQSTSSGQTALMLASAHGRIVPIKLLLDCGANPAIRDLEGSTALMCAAENSHEDIVNCLLAHPKTDPWATDNDGLDALAIAMNNGHDRITATLYSLREKRGSKRC